MLTESHVHVKYSDLDSSVATTNRFVMPNDNILPPYSQQVWRPSIPSKPDDFLQAIDWLSHQCQTMFFKQPTGSMERSKHLPQQSPAHATTPERVAASRHPSPQTLLFNKFSGLNSRLRRVPYWTVYWPTLPHRPRTAPTYHTWHARGSQHANGCQTSPGTPQKTGF